MRMAGKWGLASAGLALSASLVFNPAAAHADAAKHLFAAQKAPSRERPSAHGSYARGCLSGAVALPETGPGWQAVRSGGNRNWGHPEMIGFIERLSEKAMAAGWPGLYVGDISQPRGGPMKGGHRSHQIGLDADIWLRIPGLQRLTPAQRDEISSISVVSADRTRVNGAWKPEHHALIRMAARDPAVARIFVNAAIKQALCEGEPPGTRGWLNKVRAWWGHDSHFHVRLHCPVDGVPGVSDCVEQKPPPPGDGCGAELAWWFTDEAVHPKPPAKPRPELTLDDLPPACRETVLR